MDLKKNCDQYRAGDFVTHRIFGPGVVVGLLPGVAIVQFNKLETVRNIRMDADYMKKTGGEI